MRVHIAIAVTDINKSIDEYSQYLKCQPEKVIDNEYALFRAESLNLSLRVTKDEAGTVRHLGFEDESFDGFSTFTDSNGLLWEQFNRKEQLKEIDEAWPGQ